MRKFWVVLYSNNNNIGLYNPDGGTGRHETKEAAEDVMKRAASKKGSEQYRYFVAEAQSMAQAPVPQIDVVPLKD